jgi:hypothetical protein
LASPTFTGTPTAPTAANGTNTTQIASTAFVQNSISASGGGNVTGPASSVADNVASFNGTTGILIKDSGLSASAIANLFSAWTSYSPSASGSGSFGTGATYTGKYKLIGKTLDFQAVITTGTGTTVTSPIQVTLPLGLVATNTTTISGFNGGSGTNLTAAFVAIGANYATFGTGAALPSSTGFIINGRLEVN